MEKKTIEDVLNQKYMSANDLKVVIPAIGINKAREYIVEIQAIMKEKGYYVPKCRTKIALTKLIIKKFGL